MSFERFLLKLLHHKDNKIMPYPFIIIPKYQKYHERHRVIKLKMISEGQGFEILNNIHFRFGKRRNTSNLFCLALSSLSLTNKIWSYE